MAARDDDAAPGEPRRRPGRRRDEAKDDAILQATRDLLTERGYDAMTMDAVAERAGAGKSTVYRRWPSKVQLTVDSLLCVKQPTIDQVPDEGSLRADLLGLATMAHRFKNDELMSGLLTAIRENDEVASVFHEQFVAGRVRLMRAVLERARERGETSPDADLDMLAAAATGIAFNAKPVVARAADHAVGGRLDAVLTLAPFAA